MNNLGKRSFVLMFVVLIGMVVLVGAEPVWNSSAYNAVYYFNEDSDYYHNFTVNLSDVSNLSHFLILDINWNQGSLGPDHSNFYWLNWNDSGFSNSTSGVLKLNSTNNNETGNFTLNVFAQGDQTGTSAKFNFIINATNDAPNFTSSGIVSNYTFNSNESLQDFILTASDEENHFPLIFNITFESNNCTHGAGTGYSDNSDCDLSVFGLNVTYPTNETANIGFAPNSSYVGTYWANISVMDAAENYNCPHDYCDATYNTTNLTTYYSQLVKFTVSSSLSIDVSNCTGQILTEDTQFNCTINVTTIGETDELNISSLAFFKNDSDSSSPNNPNWFYSDNASNATNFALEIPISVTPTKNEVGNWTINFTIDDGVSPKTEQITLYVNFTEFNVTLDVISDLNGSNAIYENYTFQVNATDDDLLIRDDSVKVESLTFASNTTWVNIIPISGSFVNYRTLNVTIDHATALLSGEGNYTVLINVTDSVGNTDNKTFVVEILNDTAPNWTTSLTYPVSLNLTEDTSFGYNVSMNVSDVDVGDSITFYYENISAEFCSLNSSTFNSTSGIINFTPVDCDVGYHNVTIIASDGKLNSSKQFNFTIENIADVPSVYSLTGDNATGQSVLVENFTFVIQEDNIVNFTLIVDDFDFLIPSGQRASFYNESLTISVNTTNSSNSNVDLFNFSFAEFGNPSTQSASYNATFTPAGAQVDNYTIVINITDNSNSSTNITFYLNNFLFEYYCKE